MLNAHVEIDGSEVRMQYYFLLYVSMDSHWIAHVNLWALLDMTSQINVYYQRMLFSDPELVTNCTNGEQYTINCAMNFLCFFGKKSFTQGMY
jgi:hypothetical protein